jgi:hypothetical protein
MKNIEINLLVLRSRNMEKLKLFYGSIGIEFTTERHGEGAVHYAAQLDNAVFEIYPCRQNEQPDNCRLGLTVESLADCLKQLRLTDAKIISEPMELNGYLRAVVEDPEKRKVELRQALYA